MSRKYFIVAQLSVILTLGFSSRDTGVCRFRQCHGCSVPGHKRLRLHYRPQPIYTPIYTPPSLLQNQISLLSFRLELGHALTRKGKGTIFNSALRRRESTVSSTSTNSRLRLLYARD